MDMFGGGAWSELGLGSLASSQLQCSQIILKLKYYILPCNILWVCYRLQMMLKVCPLISYFVYQGHVWYYASVSAIHIAIMYSA